MADVPDDLLAAAVAALRAEGLVEPVMYNDDIGTAETVAYVVLKSVFDRVESLRELLIEAEDRAHLTSVENARLRELLQLEDRPDEDGQPVR